MAKTVGSLIVRIGADVSGLDRDGKHATQTLKGIAEQGRQTVNRLGAVSAAAVAAGAALVANLARQGLEAVDAQAKLARQLGGTVTGLRALEGAAGDAGVSSDALQSAMTKLNARIGEAQRGNGTAAASFERLGLNANALAQLDVDARAAAIADRMRELGLSTQQAGDELRQMGIRQSEVINLMLQGGDAIRAERDTVVALGLALSDVDARQVEAANDAMGVFEDLATGVRTQLAVEVAPIITALANKLEETAKNGTTMGERVSGAFDMVVSGAGVALDAVRGFEVILKGATLAAQGLGTGMLSVISLIYEGWTRVSGLIIDGVRAVVETANRLPGVHIPVTGLDQLSLGLQGAADQQVQLRERIQESTRQTAQELHELLMQPLPSDGLKQWVAEARALSLQAAQEMQDASAAGAGAALGVGGDGASDRDQEALEHMREHLEQRLQMFRESLMAEEELQMLQHQRRLEELQSFRDAELIGDQEHAALREAAEADHTDRMSAIRQRGAEEQRRIQEAEARARQQAVAGFFGNLTSLAESGSDELVKISKAAALVQGLISLRESVMTAYAAGSRIGGPPVGAAFAAAAGLAQAANLAALQSAGGGGGGGAGGVSTGGVAAQQAAAPVNTQSVSISVQGINASQFYSGDAVRGLIDAINDAGRDGFRVMTA